MWTLILTIIVGEGNATNMQQISMPTKEICNNALQQYANYSPPSNSGWANPRNYYLSSCVNTKTGEVIWLSK